MEMRCRRVRRRDMSSHQIPIKCLGTPSYSGRELNCEKNVFPFR